MAIQSVLTMAPSESGESVTAGRWLLDTHAFIWFQLDDRRLPAAITALITDHRHRMIVSAVSAWEIAVKYRMGKLECPNSLAENVRGAALQMSFTCLDITFEHAQRSAALPAHHKDPFDRLLIAQAMVEGLTLISTDKIFDQYGVDRIW